MIISTTTNTCVWEANWRDKKRWLSECCGVYYIEVYRTLARCRDLSVYNCLSPSIYLFQSLVQYRQRTRSIIILSERHAGPWTQYRNNTTNPLRALAKLNQTPVCVCVCRHTAYVSIK